MSSRRFPIVGLIAMVACSSAPVQPLSEEHAAAIVDSVERTLADYGRLVSAGGWDSVIGFYADDPRFHWMEDGSLRYRSRADIAAALGTVEASFTSTRLRLHDTRVIALAPAVAAASMGFDQTLTDSAGTSVSFSGVLTLIAIHTDQGWQFLTGHTSGSGPRTR